MALVTILCCTGVSAWAEVCDKVVGEDWRPEMGPQSLVYPPGNAIFPVVALLIGCFAAWRLRLIRIPVLLGLAIAALAILELAVTFWGDVLAGDGVPSAAYAEGCRSVAANLATVVFLIVCSLALACVARVNWRRRATSLLDC